MKCQKYYITIEFFCSENMLNHNYNKNVKIKLVKNIWDYNY